MFAGKSGLEVGGPSRLFGKGKLIPIYDRCRYIDNCNFSSQTIWGATAHNASDRIFRRQFIAEATDLSPFRDEDYDFVLAAHVLEHTANPLKALQEWRRVLVPGGVLLAVVPDKRVTFDRRRPFTSMEHIEEDFEGNTAESDLTHLQEILALHDLDLDPAAGSPQEFRERCLANRAVRAMHHHVFNAEVLVRMIDRMSMSVVEVSFERPGHILVVGRKIASDARGVAHSLQAVPMNERSTAFPASGLRDSQGLHRAASETACQSIVDGPDALSKQA